MKNMPVSETHNQEEGLLPEYEFEYRKARQNRFSDQMNQEPVIVVLDPDVAKVFRSSENVNSLLRAIIETMPGVPQG